MAKPNRRFETARTRRFRETSLSEVDDRTISNVETFGCSIVHVRPLVCETGPGWSYTIGVHDTCGQPELITIGLLTKTAEFLLNEAADRLRRGLVLTQGRHRGLVAKVECEFRPVSRLWVKRLMGWAVWYYGGDNFPVLQAVYPDLENRFPGEPEFDSHFEQPFLQADAPQTAIEQELWKPADRGSRFPDWKFPDSPHTSAFLSNAVHKGSEPITFVSHDSDDGAWQFLGDSMAGESKPVMGCLHHPIDRDPSLKDLADLPLGWCGERAKPGDPWTRHKQEPETSN
jgi:hypothetical protein